MVNPFDIFSKISKILFDVQVDATFASLDVDLPELPRFLPAFRSADALPHHYEPLLRAGDRALHKQVVAWYEAVVYPAAFRVHLAVSPYPEDALVILSACLESELDRERDLACQHMGDVPRAYVAYVPSLLGVLPSAYLHAEPLHRSLVAFPFGDGLDIDPVAFPEDLLGPYLPTKLLLGVAPLVFHIPAQAYLEKLRGLLTYPGIPRPRVNHEPDVRYPFQVPFSLLTLLLGVGVFRKLCLPCQILGNLLSPDVRESVHPVRSSLV